ncbi:MAG: stage II sporulation protein M [Planctomycetota bacterium]|jgi:uncharacterized membrane protein SpoIIM required for sporulation
MGDFISRNKQEWDELEELVQRGRKSIKRLPPEALARIDVLYRRATVHLSQVQSRTTDQRLASYLNSLTAAAHSLIYLPPKQSPLQGALTFVLEGFARSIARAWPFHAASAFLMLIGGFLAWFSGSADPIALYAMLPPGDPRGPGAPREFLLEVLRSGREQGGGEKFAFASFLFQHNFKVGLMAMSLGMLAAIPTVLLIIYNGMILGAFITVHHQAGIYSEVWAWLLPHGVTELGAIVLCGGMGLQLGWSVVQPGLSTRSDAIKAVAPEIGRVSVGVFGMLIFAAIIESYLRQSHLSTNARLAFAAGTAVFWTIYIWHGFRRERQDADAFE